jgi:hypothetical protein
MMKDVEAEGITKTRKDVEVEGRTKWQKHGEAKARVKTGREENKERGKM